MNCQRIQDSFIDYQDGTLAPDESAQVRAHLVTCLHCQREWAALQEITRKLDQLPIPEPSPRLHENFYAMLETHQRAADSISPFALVKSRFDVWFAPLLPSRPTLQFVLAVALLAGGLFVGARFLHHAPDTSAANATQAELAALRGRLDDMSKLVTYSLLQQKSTSERLQTVLAAMDLKSPDRQVLTELVGTLAFDPSVNVRLSAVEALAPHADDHLVRAGLVAALSRESSPLVQLAMIELLGSVRETEAVPMFERFSRDENADKNVREAARRALAALRPPSPTDAKPMTKANQPNPILS
jgi:HEAT repeats/Putative zinc-finger